MLRKASDVDMIAANRPAKTIPASSGLVNIERKREAASSGRASGSITPSITAARMITPIETHKRAAMT